MAILDIGYNLANDPYATTTDDISEYYHVQSTGFGGNFFAKKTPSVNYPVVTPGRIFIPLPMVIDRSDLTGSRPIKVVDTTIGSTMTRVTTAPTGNEYRIPPASSIRRDVIEVSSTKVGNIIDYDFYGEGTVFNADEFNTFRQYLAHKTIVADYTVTDTDYIGTINVGHTSTTALVTVVLPTVEDNQERIIRIQNTGTGLTKVDGEGAETISFLGQSVTEVYLVMEDDYIELVGTSSEWKIRHCYLSQITNLINRADWQTEEVGSAFTYDNKSNAVDWQGEHISIADGGDVQKALVLYDSGSTGDTGVLYVWAITDSGTSLGNWTNNQTVTAGATSATVDVNEATGSSKNQDYDLYYIWGVNFDRIEKKFIIDADGDYTSAWDIRGNSYIAGDLGFNWIQSSVNFIELQTAQSGVRVVQTNGAGTSLTNEDYYFSVIFVISV